MMPRMFVFTLLLWNLAHDAPASDALILKHYEVNAQNLAELYQQFHSQPELSGKEVLTSKRLANALKIAGCEVHEGIGGHGVVGVLKNGKGRVLMIRADMDALPLIEKTGLPYASKVQVRDDNGNLVGVMHACGHDINITCLAGVASVLAKMKDQWRGTILLVGQPAEETGKGARAMLVDGLFTKFPKPDFALALHCDGRFPSGHVNYRAGPMQANVDSVEIIIKGKGGHGASPDKAIDPIVIAARVVRDLQLIISRERDPLDPAVITVGSIHGGTKHNIIPAEVKLELTVRTVRTVSRINILSAIERVAQAASLGAGAPEPVVRLNASEFTPELINDAELTTKTVKVFESLLGKDKVHERPMSLGGEDFSQFVRAGVPGFYYFLGSADPRAVVVAKQGGKALAVTHSDSYFPDYEPVIKTGVRTMGAAVLFHLADK
ncbi:MAG: putative hydrolase YxeP [Planctomycetota bacterium]|jgi:hippurate hydrolase